MEATKEFQKASIAVMMGATNFMHDGSHSSNVSATDLVDHGYHSAEKNIKEDGIKKID